ncbi:hypothetical protein JCM17961_16020 [Endothiovibrio diazotrophicus]
MPDTPPPPPPPLSELIDSLVGHMDESLRSRCAIIGGQALSFWAYHYLIDELTGEEFTPDTISMFSTEFP